MNDEDLAYQNAVRNLTSPFTQDSWNPIDWNWGYGWNQTKDFGNWLLGDKDFSPLNTGISLFNALAKYKDNVEELNTAFTEQEYELCNVIFKEVSKKWN